jgi:hypothetical protein
LPDDLAIMIDACVEMLSDRSVKHEYQVSSTKPYSISAISHEGMQGPLRISIDSTIDGRMDIGIRHPSEPGSDQVAGTTWFKIKGDERWAGGRHLERLSIRSRLRHVSKTLDRARRQGHDRVRSDVERWTACNEVVRAWAKTKGEGFVEINAESPWRPARLLLDGMTSKEPVTDWFLGNVPKLLVLRRQGADGWILGPVSTALDIASIEMTPVEVMRIASRNPEAFA